MLEVGKEHEFTVLLRNNFATTREFGARLVLPEHWKPTSGGGSITLPSGKSGKIRLSASVPSQMCGKTQRQLITVEVLVDGVSHGPVAEALVYSRGS